MLLYVVIAIDCFTYCHCLAAPHVFSSNDPFPLLKDDDDDDDEEETEESVEEGTTEDDDDNEVRKSCFVWP
jgi:hypothetical protein